MAVKLNLLADIPADSPVVARAVFADRLDDAPVPAGVLSALAFEGKADQLQVVPVDGGVVVLVGLGELAGVRPAGLRKAGAQLTRALKKFPTAVVTVPADLAAARGGTDGDGQVAAGEIQALTEGLLLAGYEYTDHRSEPSKTALATIDLVVASDEARAGAERGRVLAEAVFVVRDLVNEPGGSLTPRRLARTAATLGKANGFDVTRGQ